MGANEKFKMIFKGGEKGNRYSEHWTPKFVEGTPAEVREAFADNFDAVHDEKAGDHYAPMIERKTVQPRVKPTAEETEQGQPRPPKPKPSPRPVLTEAELIMAEQKKAEEKAAKKAKMQQYCLMSHAQMEKCSAEEFVAEVKEFYFKDPKNPRTWDIILMALCDLGMMNACPYLEVNTKLAPKSLNFILAEIFSSKKWTVLMLNCFGQLRGFFDGKTWKVLRQNFLLPARIYGLRFAPEYKTDETVTMLPKKATYEIAIRWNVLRNIKMILC